MNVTVCIKSNCAQCDATSRALVKAGTDNVIIDIAEQYAARDRIDRVARALFGAPMRRLPDGQAVIVLSAFLDAMRGTGEQATEGGPATARADLDGDTIAQRAYCIGLAALAPTTHSPPRSPQPHPTTTTDKASTMTSATPVPVELTIQARVFRMLDQAAREEFGAPLDSLTHEQAMSIMSAYLHQVARRETGIQVTHNGRVTVRADLDGDPAARGAVEQTSREVAPRIDDARPLYVLIEPTLWQRLTGRKPAALHWQPQH